MSICETLGCDDEGTETRTYESVIDGHTQQGEFVATKSGTAKVCLCPMHAKWADRDGVEKFVADRCTY